MTTSTGAPETGEAAGTVTTEPQATAPVGATSRKPLERFLEGTKYAFAVSGVVGLAISLAVWAAGKRDAHLVVWKQSDTVVYPSTATAGRPLPLAFEGTRADTVSVAVLELSNYGKRLIGSERELWEVTMSFPQARRVAPLGQPTVRPQPLVASLVPQDGPNQVTLRLGMLEPEARVTVPLLVVNDRHPGYSRFHASSTLEGLPVEATAASPEGRLQNRLIAPVAVAVFLAALVGGLVERRNRLRTPIPGTPPPRLVTQIVFALILGAVGGLLLTRLMAWLIVRIA